GNHFFDLCHNDLLIPFSLQRAEQLQNYSSSAATSREAAKSFIALPIMLLIFSSDTAASSVLPEFLVIITDMPSNRLVIRPRNREPLPMIMALFTLPARMSSRQTPMYGTPDGMWP